MFSPDLKVITTLSLKRPFFVFVSQYSGVNIGPVHKKDIMKCSTMLEHDSQ